MALDAVTAAITDLLRSALTSAFDADVTVTVAPPNREAANADLVLFPFLITTNAQQRNAPRVRPFPQRTDPPKLLELAVPLDLHFLLTTGSAIDAAKSLSTLAVGIRALEAASPLTVPSAFQEAVWLSLLSMTSDELSRVWGLFPNENCRSCVTFLATPVWIDPVEAPEPGKPVIDDESLLAPSMEPA